MIFILSRDFNLTVPIVEYNQGMRTLVFLAFVTLVCSQAVFTNFGCKTLAKDRKTCDVCSDRYYKDGNGICQPVSTSCNTYDPQFGGCTSCYEGYLLVEIICIKDPRPKDPNCAQFKNGVCIKCSKGFYYQNGKCEIVSSLCKTFDYTLLECTECFGGYQLVNKQCKVSPPDAAAAGCSEYKNNQCISCARDYYMNSKGICTLVNPNCKTFDQANGQCLTCFAGYELRNGTCQISKTALDPNCKAFKDGKCSQCSKGFYFNQHSICTQTDPFCKSFDIPTESCQECYNGFVLKGNTCEVDKTNKTYDPNCKEFDSKNKCIKCSQGTYFDANGACISVSASCKTFDYAKKICTECYQGYSLDQKKDCIKDSSNQTAETNCAEFISGVCVQCIDRAYQDFDLKCVKVSDDCKSYSSFNGYCTSCYVGYALEASTGKCLPSSDATCSKTDPKTNVCIECVKGRYLDTQNQCKPIDVHCQTFNYSSRLCELCYMGYQLNQNNGCELAPMVTSPVVENCVNYDGTGKICTLCYNRYYLDGNKCVAADELCKTFQPVGGACLTCWQGLTLEGTKCVFK